ncbi:MSMEG_0568 family radical SAM protein [Bacterioplanoides sp.]|uniref:MSMEG_0568 family radical SAM protein n=1 Tax=Bacterioplanoides sp. TaxID=2066072 RepID=UPI003B008F5D
MSALSALKTDLNSELLTDIQTHGVRLVAPDNTHVSRRGGAGPSDHQALTMDGTTLMVPVYTQTAWQSPYVLEDNTLVKQQPGGERIALTDITFADTPNFYSLSTADGIPYQQIATLHSTDVLATTVLQTCIRYESRRKACRFCSIGQSLNAGRTIAEKTPQQLAEVAKAAVELDGIKHIVMTTGTPATPDRGAKVMCDSAVAIKAEVDVPIQGQCEPPKDHSWFARMKQAGIDSLGMHLEVVTPEVRKAITPGKAEVSLEEYMAAFAAAVEVFGRGQVSTYILAGLGDSKDAILDLCQELVGMGVYPFVVPFVPIRGTPLEDHPAPSKAFMESLLKPLAAMLVEAGITSEKSNAGCVKCGACSPLSRYEKELNEKEPSL